MVGPLGWTPVERGKERGPVVVVEINSTAVILDRLGTTRPVGEGMISRRVGPTVSRKEELDITVDILTTAIRTPTQADIREAAPVDIRGDTRPINLEVTTVSKEVMIANREVINRVGMVGTISSPLGVVTTNSLLLGMRLLDKLHPTSNKEIAGHTTETLELTPVGLARDRHLSPQVPERGSTLKDRLERRSSLIRATEGGIVNLILKSKRNRKPNAQQCELPKLREGTLPPSELTCLNKRNGSKTTSRVPG